ncbi:MAG: putative lipid II flippase FtsW [Deltaproteobacteria bacterium]|nr:MAG: putative lipid II flippase FtsW [Deltaproteobacteria bacterium]
MAYKKSETSRMPDLVVTAAVATLTVVGLILTFSTSKLVANGGEVRVVTSHFQKQFIYAIVGATAYLIAARMPMSLLRKLAIPALIICTALLAMVLFSPLGIKANEATRWLKLGPLRFQPSELTKLALVIFLADSLARRGAEKMRTLRYGFIPHLFIAGIPIILVLKEPDLGTAVVLGAIAYAMIFISGARLKHLLTTALLAGAVVAVEIIRTPYRMARITAFLHPEENALGSAFQLTQSKLAFSTGGAWGVGIGSGQQKLFYLPEAHTDFILSVWGEEAGLAGTLFILALFATLTIRGVMIALKQEDHFTRFLAIGITSWLGLQASINALVVLGALPTKGLPLPFLSYGGTGLVACLAAAGLLAGLAPKAVQR